MKLTDKPKTLKPFEFRGNFETYTVVAVPGRYKNMRKAIRLLDATDGSTVAMATVNLPDESLENDEVFIKDWSENEGVLLALIKAGLIENPHDLVATGHVFAERCKLTEKGMALFEWHVAKFLKDE